MSGLTQIISMNNPAFFTLPDPTKVEVDAVNNTRLKKAGTFCAKYTSDINGLWGLGILTGAPFGGADVAGGKLDLNHNDIRGVDYDAVGNADSQQTGCIEFELTIKYDPATTPEQHFFAVCKANDDTKNLIFIRHTTGSLRLHMYDNVGTLIQEFYLGYWTPLIDSVNNFSINWDLTLGVTRVFINGTQFGSTATAIGTRDSDINLLRIGRSYKGLYNSNFLIDNLIVYASVQHTSNYIVSGEPPDTLYPTDNPCVDLNTSVVTMLADQLFDFIETVVVSGGDGITYVLRLNGNPVYHNGTAWVTSDFSLAQSNTVAEILLNKETLLIDGEGKILGVSWILHSADGSTTPEAQILEINYDVSAITPVLIENTITGSVIELDGVINKTPIQITPFGYTINTNVLITLGTIMVNIFEDGSFEAKIYTEDVNPIGLIWEFVGFTIRTNFLPGNNKFSDLTVEA